MRLRQYTNDIGSDKTTTARAILPWDIGSTVGKSFIANNSDRAAISTEKLLIHSTIKALYNLGVSTNDNKSFSGTAYGNLIS